MDAPTHVQMVDLRPCSNERDPAVGRPPPIARLIEIVSDDAPPIAQNDHDPADHNAYAQKTPLIHSARSRHWLYDQLRVIYLKKRYLLGVSSKG